MKRVVLLLGVVLLLAACGGGGGGNADVNQIKHNWTSFFSPKTTVSQKVALLQDGQRFKSAITTLVKIPLASQISAKVSSVTLDGNKPAKVIYTIYLGSTNALKNEVGYAYKQNGKWLVGYAGLCQLVMLSGNTPAACNA